MKTPFTCPANAKRLFDLIHVFDEKLLPAFYFAFTDTLVASSIDQVELSPLSHLGFENCLQRERTCLLSCGDHVGSID